MNTVMPVRFGRKDKAINIEIEAYAKRNKLPKARAAIELIAKGLESKSPESKSMDQLKVRRSTGTGKHRVYGSLNTDERDLLDRMVAEEGVSVSFFVLRAVLSSMAKGPLFSQPELALLGDAKYQLMAIGRNLNQLLKALNADHSKSAVISKRYAEEINRRIDHQEEAIQKLISSKRG